jgi:hypothetical protein
VKITQKEPVLVPRTRTTKSQKIAEFIANCGILWMDWRKNFAKTWQQWQTGYDRLDCRIQP